MHKSASMAIILFIFVCYVAAFILTAESIPFASVLIPILVCVTAIFFAGMAVEAQLASSPPAPTPAGPDERTPLLPPSSDAEAGRPMHGDRRFLNGSRLEIIGTWMSLASAVLMIGFGAASFFVDRRWRPPSFSLGWGLTATFGGLMITVCYFLCIPRLAAPRLPLTPMIITANGRTFIRRGKFGPLATGRQDASYRNERYCRRNNCLEFIYQASLGY